MNDKFFVDTNILVYANDQSDKIKQQVAKEIILNGIRNDQMVISTQVLSEFYVTVTQKIKITLEPKTALHIIELLRFAEITEVELNTVVRAIHISQDHKLSYWDSLIIAAALSSEAMILYSEDLNHGQLIEDVKIINPFL